ncbi:NAD(P)-dependent oxidoreductase [Jiangella ureilytica]|uniref:NAD(P)-dependent oxidoreductase n=1 Tax=Jiangella ureilytica TaxID=2530374 RepID=A0A4R4RI19_9ACTN|nr:NAD(P)-dependent oxidoreductase [Jiangella ureilytica]TDC48936.1 NAD(P)-dependent oxidoreductase [Jiangella ureilytica]
MTGRVLVTGGLGSIGAHTARALLDLGGSVVLTRRRPTPLPSFLAGYGPDRVAVADVDVTDTAAVLAIGREHAIGGVVHLAAAGLEVTDPVAFLRANTAGLLNVLQGAQEWGVTRFAVASSIGSYAGNEPGPWHEGLGLALNVPIHQIPAFKLGAEVFTNLTARQSGFDAVNLRIGSVWGPLGHPESPFLPIPWWVRAAVQGVTPALAEPPYADDGGDRVYVKDCGRAIALLMTADRLAHDTYNVSSGEPATHREFADAIAAAVPGTEVELKPGRSPGAPERDPFLDVSRLRAGTGFAPEYDVERGVADYVAWLRAGNAS